MSTGEFDVCIVDDDEAIRESLRLLLFSDGLSSCTFPSAEAFLEADEQVSFSCMLLDIRMPGKDGLELFQILNRQSRVCPVIFITGHGDIPLAVSAMKQGAFDFLTKPFEEGELLGKVRAAIDRFHSDRAQMSEREALLNRYRQCTPREVDVMNLLAAGLSNKGIADQLGISPRTVEIHRAHVMEKMEAESLPALVRMVAQLEPED